MTFVRGTLFTSSSSSGIVLPRNGIFSTILTIVLLAPLGATQEAQAPQNANDQKPAVVIPAGTRLALVLTHPVDSKSTHRGDEIYAQTTAPVLADNHIAIPAGTFVQAKVDKLTRRGSRAEMSMQSLAFVFPNGYVADLRGPVTLESEEGTAFNNPSSGAKVGAFIAPFAGSGLGALIGSAAHTTQTATLGGMSITSNSPRGVAIGSIAGLAAGGTVSLALLARSHSFYVDVGSSVHMDLSQPVTLDGQQVAAAVAKAAQHPAQIVVKRAPPVPLPPVDHGTCYTPGTPATPDIIIPGTPAIGDSPGTPPTVIPGTPATPGTPYPCP